jgi:hypothetical protein
LLRASLMKIQATLELHSRVPLARASGALNKQRA